MNVKYTETREEKIRKVAESQNGTLLASDLTRLEIPRVYLSIMEKNGEIERTSRGVYRLTHAIEDELFGFQARHKACVYSHGTALYLHDLTDRAPLFFTVTVPSGYHSQSLNASRCKVFYVNRRLHGLGVASVPSPHGNPIKVAGLERTICDIVRSRNQLDSQSLGESLRRYLAKKEKDINLLYQYARSFRVLRLVRDYLEVLL
ncbi:MAG: type IV toxin-antitoxin system AbiEi family antitoxin domain-containing protein [Anaerolineales bacterium]|nr:type IV toxin-antitoxin system AbiEi family antitoxin domain-containing protein [Anaerolineales bacterium]